MSGRLMRRRIVHVCEVEFDKLDRRHLTDPDALLCEIEVVYTHPPHHPMLSHGMMWLPITVWEYLHGAYYRDVDYAMAYFRRYRKHGAQWRIVPAPQL